MAKTGKKTIAKAVSSVKSAVKKAVTSNTVLLRNSSTGEFSEGKKPCVTCSPSGNKGGVPFWEV